MYIMVHIKKKTTDMQWPYADNTFLPLRRRRAKTLRPFFVLIRARNPCSLFRLRLFGWNVLFTLLHLLYKRHHHISI